MPLPKITKLLSLMCAVGVTTSCASSPEFPKDFRPWEVEIYHPYLYSTSADYIHGYNKEHDFVFPVHRPSYPSIMYSMNNIRRLLDWQDYDGFGLQLTRGAIGRQIGDIKTLPDQVFVEWQAFDYAIYKTRLDVTDEMKTVMKTPRPHPRGLAYPCYQTTFAFGLLPDGRAKVWLYGCEIFTYVGELDPVAKKRTNPREHYGDDNGFYLRAKELGVKAEPIPWDKVEKVYYSDKMFTMNTLEEAINESKRDH